MAKPRITAAAVTAAYDVIDRSIVPDNYYQVSSAEQRSIRMSVVRQALIAAQLADRQAPALHTTPIGFMDVEGLSTLVGEVQARLAASPASQDRERGSTSSPTPSPEGGR